MVWWPTAKSPGKWLHLDFCKNLAGAPVGDNVERSLIFCLKHHMGPQEEVPRQETDLFSPVILSSWHRHYTSKSAPDPPAPTSPAAASEMKPNCRRSATQQSEVMILPSDSSVFWHGPRNAAKDNKILGSIGPRQLAIWLHSPVRHSKLRCRLVSPSWVSMGPLMRPAVYENLLSSHSQHSSNPWTLLYQPDGQSCKPHGKTIPWVSPVPVGMDPRKDFREHVIMSILNVFKLYLTSYPCLKPIDNLLNQLWSRFPHLESSKQYLAAQPRTPPRPASKMPGTPQTMRF